MPAINASAKISVHAGQNQNMAANESVPRQKRSILIGSKDSTPQKRKSEQSYPKNTLEKVPHFTQEEVMGKSTISKTSEEAIVLKKTQVPEETIEAPEEALVPNNKEISIFNKRYVE